MSVEQNRSVFEKRMSSIRRQMERHPEAVDASAREPMGSGPTNRHGMPNLPTGQHQVKNWPVLDLGVQPLVPESEWCLTVGGLVENPLELTFEDLLALPQVEQECDFHCVTTWSRMDCRFGGVAFATIAELAMPKEEARHVFCTGHDQLPGTDIAYTTNLPLHRAVEDDVLLVHREGGEPLPREHGGPVRMVTPKLYAWKGTKWIRSIELTAEDRPGFWEVRGYSNTAEPWLNDRYSRRA